jgi:hypothetical protein
MPSFLLSKTYAVITPESAEAGDYSDRGFEFQDREVNAREAVRAFRECSELSVWPANPQNCAGTWANTEAQQDYLTGGSTEYAYHLTRVDGSPVSSRTLFRLYRAAGLTKGIL